MTMADVAPGARIFTLKSQLLAKGSHTHFVAKAEHLSVAVKIYASGGENKPHQHPEEDHAFIILQGQATFHLGGDNEPKVVNANEGVMLPAGTSYWFTSTAPENLVMIRVGATKETPKVWRALPDGSPFVESGEKKNGSPVFAAEYFA